VMRMGGMLGETKRKQEENDAVSTDPVARVRWNQR
jgi:hypothetical protein